SAEQKAGAPICVRIDVTDADTNHLGSPDLKVPFPEYDFWGIDELSAIQPIFNKTADQLAEIIRTNNCPIYVHCTVGMNRSVAILTAALTKLTGRTVRDILSEIRKQRSIAAPDDSYY